MATEQPAAAGSKTAAEITPVIVKGVKLIRLPMEENKRSHPAATYASDTAPKEGTTLEFTLENGVTYQGVVSEAVSAKGADGKGEVLAEFSAPLKVITTK